MKLAKRYHPTRAEPALQARWAEQGTHHFQRNRPGPVYAIDTPPATVSGNLHLGHAYSYTQTDFAARFWRMCGHNVFYPMGFDDNGLPTGHYVTETTGITANDVGRREFTQLCLDAGDQAGQDYRALWQRLALSIDWRHTYRTIDAQSLRIAQHSFIELYRQGSIYRRLAPSIWCPRCQTAIAQAELDDLDRSSTFYTLAFQGEDGSQLAIATTRPELLPACVAIFVHPDDPRYAEWVGSHAAVPLFGQHVPVLSDPAADPDKGTGAVMCCTFGDVTDIAWWREHQLPLIEGISRSGHLTDAAGPYAGLPLSEGRQAIIHALSDASLLLAQEPIAQSVRVHERCDTPVEYVMTEQWFLRLLDRKEELLAAGDRIRWHPQHMQARYRQWVETLNWDWCLSRQRAFGVPFPAWHCPACGGVVLADTEALPVDPTGTLTEDYASSTPPAQCPCGNTQLEPDTDVMDTWATSSLSPQIAGRWLEDDGLYDQVYPMSMRPQAHEIIRTWAFYTIVKSLYHFDTVPWTDIAISGWGIAGEGMGKISKSRGGGPMPPLEMIEKYSADAVRYWAASTGLGKDAVISEKKIEMGQKLVNKLWNVARFSQRFLEDYAPEGTDLPQLSPADRWILARAQRLVRRTTQDLRNYEHAAAKNEIETFFWTELADNYLEMSKMRLYGDPGPLCDGARFALHRALLTTIKLFAPFLPHVTEQIYQALYATGETESIHLSTWPTPDERFEDEPAEQIGAMLVHIATAVRRYKSEHSLPLGAEIGLLECASGDDGLDRDLQDAIPDLASITRAQEIRVTGTLSPSLLQLSVEGPSQAALRV